MSFEVDKDVALLYGILLGDGCLSSFDGRKKFITITGSNNDLQFFKEIIAPILLKFRGKETNIKFRTDCNAVEFNFTDMKLFDFIHSLGFPIGKKGINISVPSLFYEKDLMKYIVQGFIATDGSLVLTKNPNKYYPRIEGNGISKQLIEQIKDYLVSIGMKGSSYPAKRKGRYSEYNAHQQFRFQFNGKKNLLIFNDKIGFVNPAYQKKFNGFIEYDQNYIPKNKVRMAQGRIELPTPAS